MNAPVRGDRQEQRSSRPRRSRTASSIPSVDRVLAHRAGRDRGRSSRPSTRPAPRSRRPTGRKRRTGPTGSSATHRRSRPSRSRSGMRRWPATRASRRTCARTPRRRPTPRCARPTTSRSLEQNCPITITTSPHPGGGGGRRRRHEAESPPAFLFVQDTAQDLDRHAVRTHGAARSVASTASRSTPRSPPRWPRPPSGRSRLPSTRSTAGTSSRSKMSARPCRSTR